VHLPSEPDTLHALHCSAHAPSQQRPSTQKFDWHCAFEEQTLPFTTLPHELATQGWPTQSPSAAHEVAHTAPWHLNGAHVTVCGGAHVPAPSHLAASLSSFFVASHELAAHTVPLAYSWHAPLPSHRPFCLQVDSASLVHAVCGAGAARPAGTAEQVPARFGRLHCSQLPVQALLQQTPSTQWA
jgi:hypothetical protein